MRIASSYLEDRTLIVETEGGSTEVEITAGFDGLLRLELPKDVAMVATAAFIDELEWKCNETLEIICYWMKVHGLQLVQEKSEAILVTKRTKFEHPKLELDGYTIQFQDSIRYLGNCGYMDRQALELQRPHSADIGQSRECRHSATTADAQCGRP